MKWTDTEALAVALVDKHPTLDPLSVRFRDLHRYVLRLEDFDDDPRALSESKLEAIQMAWYEEWRQEFQE